MLQFLWIPLLIALPHADAQCANPPNFIQPTKSDKTVTERCPVADLNCRPVPGISSHRPWYREFFQVGEILSHRPRCLNFGLLIGMLSHRPQCPAEGRPRIGICSHLPRCPAADPNLNLRPVIGILSHQGDGASGRLSNATGASYIAASYVKFVESAGARVIPLIYNEPSDVLHQKLNLINGVIFTGGWAKKGLYVDVVKSIFQYVLKKNDAGHHFPLFAIDLGFELLSMIVSEDNNILERFSASNHASTLDLLENVDINGTIFERFPPVLLKKLSTECLAMQNHRYGISPEKFQKSKSLSSFFRILTTSADDDDKVYVSTVQSRSYPVTAVQWHPEKNAFEWGSAKIPHSEDAVQVTQHVANFFIREARLSTNRPSSQNVLDKLIYNYSPTYGGKAGKGFDEVYIFS